MEMWSSENSKNFSRRLRFSSGCGRIPLEMKIAENERYEIACRLLRTSALAKSSVDDYRYERVKRKIGQLKEIRKRV
jgi:hypothetical protein